jgi:hypothetical protein
MSEIHAEGCQSGGHHGESRSLQSCSEAVIMDAHGARQRIRVAEVASGET